MSELLKKELCETGFNFIEVVDGLLLIDDFISKEELEEIFGFIDKAVDEDWRVEYLANLAQFCMMKFGRDDVENLIAEGKYNITQNWEDKNLNISQSEIHRVMYSRLNNLLIKSESNLNLSGFATIQRMQEGVELKSHKDQTTDPSIQFGTILYLNDEYKGGEVFFEDKNIALRPKPGSLLIFPGDFEHGVKHVGAGPIRYVIVGFIKANDFYENNKY